MFASYIDIPGVNYCLKTINKNYNNCKFSKIPSLTLDKFNTKFLG